MMDQTPTGPGWYWGQYEGGKPICIEVDEVAPRADGNQTIFFGPNSRSALVPSGMLHWLGRVVETPLLITLDDVELRGPTTEEIEECARGVNEAAEQLAQAKAEGAIAFLGARVIRDYYRGDQGFMSPCGDELDQDAEEAGVMDGSNFDLLPGIEGAMLEILGEQETDTRCGFAAVAREIMAAHDSDAEEDALR